MGRRCPSSTPAQKGSVFVDPFHFEIGEVAHLCQRGFGGCYEALFLVEIDEDIQLVADADILWDVAGRKEDFSLVTTIEIQTEINFLYDAKAIVIAEFYLCSYNIIFSFSSVVGASATSAVSSWLSAAPASIVFSIIPSLRWMVRSVMEARPSS